MAYLESSLIVHGRCAFVSGSDDVDVDPAVLLKHLLRLALAERPSMKCVTLTLYHCCYSLHVVFW